MKITIALAQMDIGFGKPAENFSKIESFVAQPLVNTRILWFFRNVEYRL